MITCPYCGHTSIDVDGESGIHAVEPFTTQSKTDGRELYGVKCNWCGANGPLCDDPIEAVDKFNAKKLRVMVCPKSQTCNRNDDGIGAHCHPHLELEGCAFGADDCPACVPYQRTPK